MNKELKIEIPEGYEIDVEKSSFEKIIFRPINITYEQVWEKLASAPHLYYINALGSIEEILNYNIDSDFNNATSIRQLEKVLAINQLFNIALYYNSKYNTALSTQQFKRCYIGLENNTYNVYYNANNYNGMPYFLTVEDAKRVISNPNFMPILDKIFKL